MAAAAEEEVAAAVEEEAAAASLVHRRLPWEAAAGAVCLVGAGDIQVAAEEEEASWPGAAVYPEEEGSRWGIS